MTSAVRRFNPFRIWHELSLAPRIVGALAIGVIVGLIFHEKAAVCREFSDIILKLLRALVIPLIFVAVVSFFLSPFIVRHLGGTAYGVWSLLVALVGYLGLLDFGVRGAVTRFVANYHAVGDAQGSSSIVSAGLLPFIFQIFCGGCAFGSI